MNRERPDAHEIDAKSLLSVLQSGIGQGQKMSVRAEGPDADAALAALRELIEHTLVDSMKALQSSRWRTRHRGRTYFPFPSCTR